MHEVSMSSYKVSPITEVRRSTLNPVVVTNTNSSILKAPAPSKPSAITVDFLPSFLQILQQNLQYILHQEVESFLYRLVFSLHNSNWL